MVRCLPPLATAAVHDYVTFERAGAARGSAWRPAGEPLLVTRADWDGAAAVEGDHYLTTPAQRDAIEAIIEDGRADMLRKALPPVVLALDDTAAVAAAHPDTVARLGLDDAGCR